MVIYLLIIQRWATFYTNSLHSRKVIEKMQMPLMNRYAERPSELSTGKVNKHIKTGKASLTTLLLIF